MWRPAAQSGVPAAQCAASNRELLYGFGWFALRAFSINSMSVAALSFGGARTLAMSSSLRCWRRKARMSKVCHQQPRMRLHGSSRPGYRRTTVECGPHGPTRRP